MRRMGLLGVCVGLGFLGSTARGAWGQWNSPNPVVSFEKTAQGLEVKQKEGVLRLDVNAEDVLHVTYCPLTDAAPARAFDWVVVKKDWPAAPFEVSSDDKAITLSTSKLRVMVERASGAVHYVALEEATGTGAAGPVATGPGSTGRAMRGRPLTTDGYRSLRPVEVNGEKTFHAEVVFPIYGSHEGFYGLGQHQAGVWNYRG